MHTSNSVNLYIGLQEAIYSFALISFFAYIVAPPHTGSSNKLPTNLYKRKAKINNSIIITQYKKSDGWVRPVVRHRVLTKYIPLSLLSAGCVPGLQHAASLGVVVGANHHGLG